jgi:hypothetical protein
MSLFFDCIHECAIVTILIHNVIVIPCLKILLVFNYELRGADSCQGFDFVNCTLSEHFIFLELFDGDNLDCEFS